MKIKYLNLSHNELLFKYLIMNRLCRLSMLAIEVGDAYKKVSTIVGK